MSDVLYARPVAPPVTPADVGEMARQAGGCFDLHRVDWILSFLSSDGGRMICWYRAGDAESVRLALRQLGSDPAAVWPVRVRRGADVETAGPCVVAELEVSGPDAADAAAEAAAGLAVPGSEPLTPLLGFVGNDGRRMAWIYRADAAAVAAALEAAGLVPARIWAGRVLDPSALDA